MNRYPLSGRLSLLWPFLVANKFLVGGALLAGALKFTIPLIIISLTAEVIDTITSTTVYEPQVVHDILFSTTWVIALVLCISLPSAFFRQYLTDTLVVRAARDLRIQVFTRLLDLPFLKRTQHRAGDLGARLLTDVQQTASLLGEGLIYFWIDLVSIIIVSVFILYEDFLVGGLCLLVLPIYYWSLGYFRQRIRHLSLDVQRDLGCLSAHVQERVQAVQMIQDHGAAAFETHSALQVFDQARRSAQRRSRMKSTSVMVSNFLTQLPSFVVLGVGGIVVAQGYLTVGSFAAITLFVRQIFWPLDNLANFNVKLAAAQGAMDRLLEIQEPESRVQKNEHIADEVLYVKSLTLDQVSASYAGTDGDVLLNVTCRAVLGDWVAVVGESGTGKTTLTRILMRWLPMTQGKILVNDVSIENVTLGAWRNAISYVSQDNILLSGKLIDNIAYARNPPDYDRAWQVCEAACVADFIRSLPCGMDHPVTEFGNTLSAGQVQRLCLARALYRRPQVLVLDEVTANLDETTERKVYAAVRDLMRGGIIISVAHRPAVMSFATHVLRLDRNRHGFHFNQQETRQS
ncbi:ABC transporter ATP-binding protein [Pseudovibrio sp. Tun.PSC04-5.I4]|uniref:ABC transporter ATP-binding protein n=1 Tax=Pseudovibrio sp. Tun.PSC04-5.I4 TaxID=1798213 RepID=UPI0013564CDD|nr:ABC transporter ATP-binding protein [Pseudovibrio sp. Tun.PSC04-5.I4]